MLLAMKQGEMRIVRPRLVGDAIEIGGDGLHVGIYGPYMLKSAYQPIFEFGPANHLAVVAFEGLIRPHCKGREIPPRELFSSISRNDHQFIECMCRALHLRNYRHATPGSRTLFVNMDLARYPSISEMKLNFEYFLNRFEMHGLTRENCVIEIVETSPGTEAFLSWAADCAREYSIRLAIDDFGQAHSDMSRFEYLKPDIVKIDRMLFRRACDEPTVRKLLAFSIRHFREEGASVLVEGIETMKQCEQARELGADLVQGYFLGRPKILPTVFDAGLLLPESDVIFVEESGTGSRAIAS